MYCFVLSFCDGISCSPSWPQILTPRALITLVCITMSESGVLTSWWISESSFKWIQENSSTASSVNTFLLTPGNCFVTCAFRAHIHLLCRHLLSTVYRALGYTAEAPSPGALDWYICPFSFTGSQWPNESLRGRDSVLFESSTYYIMWLSQGSN